MQQTHLRMVGRIAKADVSVWNYDRIYRTQDYTLLDQEIIQFPVDRLFRRIRRRYQRLFLDRFQVGPMIWI